MDYTNFNFTVGTERINEITNSVICNMSSLNYFDLFIYLIIPILITIFGLILLLNKEKFQKWIESKYISSGYIKILYVNNSKRGKYKILPLDKYKNFTFGTGKKKKMYSLQEMEKYIAWYDEKNTPVFLYKENFILPFIIDDISLTKQIKEEFELEDDIDSESKIPALKMMLEPNVLNMIYDKKLLSDLYDTSVSDQFKEKLVWALLIGIGLIIAYYTGLIDKIFTMIKGL